MQVGVVGINHKLANLPLIESIAKAFQKCFGNKIGHVLLSTCNRVELYFSGHDLAEAHTDILSLLKQEIEPYCDQKLYSYFGVECFLHLSKVTSGFDSAIMLETEIQGQVKQSYMRAANNRKLSSSLHSLFQKSLQISKYIRSKYDLGRGMPDIEHAIYQMGTQIFQTPQDQSILFVGSSAINQKVLEHMKKKGCQRITLCNRTQENANKVSLKYQIPTLCFSDLETWPEFDWVILGTTAPHYLIHPQMINSKKLIIDLSVPRNVNPDLGKNPLIELRNLGQIQRMLKFRRKWIDSAFNQALHEITHLVSRHSLLFQQKQIHVLELFA